MGVCEILYAEEGRSQFCLSVLHCSVMPHDELYERIELEGGLELAHWGENDEKIQMETEKCKPKSKYAQYGDYSLFTIH